ncbi:unnamed protein product [Lota lota]
MNLAHREDRHQGGGAEVLGAPRTAPPDGPSCSGLAPSAPPSAAKPEGTLDAADGSRGHSLTHSLAPPPPRSAGVLNGWLRGSAGRVLTRRAQEKRTKRSGADGAQREGKATTKRSPIHKSSKVPLERHGDPQDNPHRARIARSSDRSSDSKLDPFSSSGMKTKHTHQASLQGGAPLTGGLGPLTEGVFSQAPSSTRAVDKRSPMPKKRLVVLRQLDGVLRQVEVFCGRWRWWNPPGGGAAR